MATNIVSLRQVLQTRNPLIPSSMVTLVITAILNLFVIFAIVFRAALWSMQGTKKLCPFRNFPQLSRYVTVSIFISQRVQWHEVVEVLGVEVQCAHGWGHHLHAL